MEWRCSSESITVSEVEMASERIASNVSFTPVLTSGELNALFSKNGGEVELFFKAENLQPTRSFKIRGASNALLSTLERSHADIQGVIGYSSGNHGLALAHLCRLHKLKCAVVVPDRVPVHKQSRIEQCGGEVIVCDSEHFTAKTKMAESLVATRPDHVLIEPSNNRDVILGHATLGLELLREVNNLDAVVVTLSGGGLLAGMVSMVRMVQPNCRIMVVQPMGKNFEACLRLGDPLAAGPPLHLPTDAEGIMSRPVAHLPLTLMQNHIDPEDVFSVTDDHMREAVNLIKNYLDMKVELSSGAGLAALDQILERHPHLKRVALVLCGGNVPSE